MLAHFVYITTNGREKLYTGRSSAVEALKVARSLALEGVDPSDEKITKISIKCEPLEYASFQLAITDYVAFSGMQFTNTASRPCNFPYNLVSQLNFKVPNYIKEATVIYTA